MNGSPLFTGDAGSGESEIRRCILENDLLEALIALPEQLFYNTGIATYVWVVTNRKTAPARARCSSSTRRRSGCRCARASATSAGRFLQRESTKFFNSTGRCPNRISLACTPPAHFGYRKITVERPLRLNFQASDERIARLAEQGGFRNLATSKKKGKAGETEIADGEKQQMAIRAALGSMPKTIYKDREEFGWALDKHLEAAELGLTAAVMKAIFAALGERDQTAEMCRDRNGNAEPDPELRDYENVPLDESVDEYFAREVTPSPADTSIDRTVIDDNDRDVGRVG